jgi:hypothetical protein
MTTDGQALERFLRDYPLNPASGGHSDVEGGGWLNDRRAAIDLDRWTPVMSGHSDLDMRQSFQGYVASNAINGDYRN